AAWTRAPVAQRTLVVPSSTAAAASVAASASCSFVRRSARMRARSGLTACSSQGQAVGRDGVAAQDLLLVGFGERGDRLPQLLDHAGMELGVRVVGGPD